jgi:drug/metabolite transporter (DMT)-like permease
MLSRQGRRNYAVGLALVLLGALGFSFKSILIKLAYAAEPGLDAVTLLALRMLFSLPFFICAALWHHLKAKPEPLSKKQWLIVTLLGLDGYYLASLLDFASLQYISAGLERVILFLYPTFVVLFSAALFRRRITAAVLAALVLSYTGLVLVFLDHLAAPSPNLWLGAALVLASALVFAGFTMGSGVMVHKIGSFRFTAYTMTAAGLATLTHFAVQRRGSVLSGFSAG